MFLREVFQCSVLICFWRVRHAWHKNLIKRCPESETRAQISRRLGQSVYNICSGSGTLDLFDDFMEDFVDASDFIDYFKAVWYPRIGKTLFSRSEISVFAINFTIFAYFNQLISFHNQHLLKSIDSYFKEKDRTD